MGEHAAAPWPQVLCLLCTSEFGDQCVFFNVSFLGPTMEVPFQGVEYTFSSSGRICWFQRPRRILRASLPTTCSSCTMNHDIPGSLPLPSWWNSIETKQYFHRSSIVLMFLVAQGAFFSPFRTDLLYPADHPYVASDISKRTKKVKRVSQTIRRKILDF